MTCPLLRQEETTVEVGEITIRQGVAETVMTLHRQEEAGTVRTRLCYTAYTLTGILASNASCAMEIQTWLRSK